jgi:hypothetical protein
MRYSVVPRLPVLAPLLAVLFLAFGLVLGFWFLVYWGALRSLALAFAFAGARSRSRSRRRRPSCKQRRSEEARARGGWPWPNRHMAQPDGRRQLRCRAGWGAQGQWVLLHLMWLFRGGLLTACTSFSPASLRCSKTSPGQARETGSKQPSTD